MAIIRKSQIAKHVYYSTAFPKDCECHICHEPIWRKPEDETAVHWSLGGNDVYLHDDCAVKFAVSLLNDAKNSQEFNNDKLKYTIKRLQRVTGELE